MSQPELGHNVSVFSYEKQPLIYCRLEHNEYTDGDGQRLGDPFGRPDGALADCTQLNRRRMHLNLLKVGDPLLQFLAGKWLSQIAPRDMASIKMHTRFFVTTDCVGHARRWSRKCFERAIASASVK